MWHITGHKLKTCTFYLFSLGENTVAQKMNDDMIRALNEDDTNEVGDGGTSDAEGEGYKCVVSFQDGMKELDYKCLF